MRRAVLILIAAFAMAVPLPGCGDSTNSEQSDAAGTGGASGAGAGANEIEPVACDILEIWKGRATECEVGSECFYDTTCTGGDERRLVADPAKM